MSVRVIVLRSFRLLGWVMLLAVVSGCAGVKVDSISNDDYLSQRRGDVLTTGQLSASSRAALQVVGITEKTCRKALGSCRLRLQSNIGLRDENRMAALSELWLLGAMQRSDSDLSRLNAYLQSIRYAYAYLFFTERSTAARAMEDRQTQVRDYYNYGSQEVLPLLLKLYPNRVSEQMLADGKLKLKLAGWEIKAERLDIRLAKGRQLPKELLPASSLTFAGLRNQYRRDGLGAEMVAVTDNKVVSSRSVRQSWSETPFPAMTVVIRFPGETLQQVLDTRQVQINGYDPYRTKSFKVAGQSVPLAANFTSGYGLWLARSGFARQSLLTLIGRGEVLESPHVYLMQPYDPNRQVIVMLHGLASSPEAWINVANEVLGDEELRSRYQIWQLYYPTNLPIALNNHDIRQALEKTMAYFDPEGSALASQNMVLVGHSMGGVLSRLLVSSSEESVWQSVQEHFQISSSRRSAVLETIKPYVYFDPLPQVSRAVFVAAPHRGTPMAEHRVAQWISGLVRLPVSVLGRFSELAQVLIDPNSAAPVALDRGFNSIANLSEHDPFIRTAATLPISPKVRYHSIIGKYEPELALQDSSDGVVPYRSAHLPGAASEKVISAWHSVQETPEAIIEIRRILHQHLLEQGQL